jgi:hypothetical protein
MARTALRSLRIVDYEDRELFHILNDNADEDGWITTDDLSEIIRINHPDGAEASEKERNAYARHCIATRFTWMVRFKWVERNEKRTKWRLTEIGRNLMNGELTEGVERALNEASHGDRILIMRALTGDYRSQDPASIMLRRQWQHGTFRNGK